MENLAKAVREKMAQEDAKEEQEKPQPETKPEREKGGIQKPKSE